MQTVFVVSVVFLQVSMVGFWGFSRVIFKVFCAALSDCGLWIFMGFSQCLYGLYCLKCLNVLRLKGLIYRYIFTCVSNSDSCVKALDFKGLMVNVFFLSLS